MTETARGGGRVLVIDDEEVMQDILGQLFESNGYQVSLATDGETGLNRLREEDHDLVFLDLMLPGMSGLEVLHRIKKLDAELPVVMVTAYATVETAIEAMKRGAFDYLVKPFRNDELLLAAERAMEQRQLRLENMKLKHELREKYRFDNIIGRCEAMQAVFDLIAQAAPSRSTMLVEGESGTGKELVARAIHHASLRADAPFVVVHCGNLSQDPQEQESTLFGHVPGAFSGAAENRKGLFEMADGGSLFFDEVSAINLDVQAKLLRFLSEREVVRVGSSETLKIDVRIIAATNTHLRDAVNAATFREDLLYRLRVIAIMVPPLRDRLDDIPLLTNHFLQKYARENDKKVRTISPDALRLLESYDWPGNVRELENVIQKAVVLSRSDEIAPALISDDVRGRQRVARPRARDGAASYKDLVEDFEREVIIDALGQADGVQKRAAQLLGLKPTTLNEKIKRFRIRYRA